MMTKRRCCRMSRFRPPVSRSRCRCATWSTPVGCVTDADSGGPPYLLGICALAGHLVSVLDVAAFLGLRQRGLNDVACCWW